MRAPEMHSLAEIERQTGPYLAAVPARIANWIPQIGGADLADVEDATRQLVDFDTYARRALGNRNPALGPMAAILLRTESASSSQIEQLATSAKRLALAEIDEGELDESEICETEIDEGEKANALTVIGNVRAMEAALDLAADVSENTVLAMHRALMLRQPGFDPAEAGRFRAEQVWIGPGDAGPRTADFVAPQHSRIAAGIADLMQFTGRQDLPVLVQVAVAHAQFETIHPFTDGNGRTGRALAQSILRNKGLVGSTAVPVSAGLLVNIRQYFAALGDFREGDAGPIIRSLSQASRIAATTGSQLVDDLAAELDRSRAKLQGVRLDAAAWRILPVLIAQPVVNTRYLMRELGFGEMAALRALATLADRGVLRETTGRARGRVWQHPEILQTLDAYASEIRRMSVG